MLVVTVEREEASSGYPSRPVTAVKWRWVCDAPSYEAMLAIIFSPTCTET